MNLTRVPISQVRRNISKLINRVANGDERVILTFRGKPKVALVSLADVKILEEMEKEERLVRWEHWVSQNEELSQQILNESQADQQDFDALYEAIQAENEVIESWVRYAANPSAI